MNNEEKQVIDEILERKGKCMHWSRCAKCPFTKSCILSSLSKPEETLKYKERVRLALDKLSSIYLLGQED